MDVSLNNVDNVTLEYLMNPAQYDKYLIGKDTSQDDFNRDTKFYRRRILALTRDLFKGKIEDNAMNSCFHNYIRSCIDYLKFVDTSDIIQGDYNDISDNVIFSDIAVGEIDNSLMLNNPVKKCTLDRFVNIKKSKPQRKIVPKQKNINLKDPKLKKKGLKKKNIPNNYEKDN